ncbi:MAG TPA: CocE/NonD family hydrolase [Acetobacteraceae bacterium]|nr:CocE/NonD family hydrolase [Acetobacteraceae bacterium]
MSPAPVHEQTPRLRGDPRDPITLEVTLDTPPGTGPFPLAVMNHGATKANADNRGERYHFTFSAYDFLSRGYAVALPMMRGFAGSGGGIVHRGCDVAAVGAANARDIRAVIDALAARPEIDTTHRTFRIGGWGALRGCARCGDQG